LTDQPVTGVIYKGDVSKYLVENKVNLLIEPRRCLL